MKITKYTNYIQIEGLEEHSQAYDENSFIVKRLDGSSVLFLLEIVSPFEVKLNLNEESDIDEIYILNISITNNQINSITNKPIEDKPEEDIKPVNKKLEYHIEDNGIYLDTEIDVNIEMPFIKLKSFSLDRYEDFPDEVKVLEYDIDTNSFKYPFELDKIYKIHIDFIDDKIDFNYIHNSPRCYYSSIYHLNQLASNFEIYINRNKLSEFDLKLLIWRYSRIASSIAGITYDDIRYEYKNSILGDYVGQRVMLDIVSQAIKEINLTPDEAKNNLGDVSVTLADLSHGTATQETVTTQLLKVHKALLTSVRELESNLRNYFSYLTTTVNVQHKIQRNKEVKRITDFDPNNKRR